MWSPCVFRLGDSTECVCGRLGSRAVVRRGSCSAPSRTLQLASQPVTLSTTFTPLQTYQGWVQLVPSGLGDAKGRYFGVFITWSVQFLIWSEGFSAGTPEEGQSIWSKRRQGFQPCFEAGIRELPFLNWSLVQLFPAYNYYTSYLL